MSTGGLPVTRVLCQLGAQVGLREIARRWQPWIFEDDPAPCLPLPGHLMGCARRRLV
ncbi:MAG: hypothetical protein ACRDTD_20575 [Pseudonocardiaceae bacterium]